MNKDNMHDIYNEKFIEDFNSFLNNKIELIENKNSSYFKYNLFFEYIMNVLIFNKDENFDVPRIKEIIKDIFFNMERFSDKNYRYVNNYVRNTYYDNINKLKDYGFYKYDEIKDFKIKDFVNNLIDLYKKRIDTNYSINKLLSYSIYNNIYYSNMYLYKKNDNIFFYKYTDQNELFFYPYDYILNNNQYWIAKKEDIINKSKLKITEIPINYGILFRNINSSNLYLYYYDRVVREQLNEIKNNNFIDKKEITYNNLTSSFIGFYLMISYLDSYIGNYIQYNKNSFFDNRKYLNITKNTDLTTYNENHKNSNIIQQYIYTYNNLFNRIFIKNNEYSFIDDIYEMNIHKYLSPISYDKDGNYIFKSDKYNINEFFGNIIRSSELGNIYDYDLIKYREEDLNDILPYNEDKLIYMFLDFQDIEKINNLNYYISSSFCEDDKYFYISGGVNQSYLLKTNNTEIDNLIKNILNIPYIPIEGEMYFNSFVKYNKDILFKYRDNISIERSYLYQYNEEFDEILSDKNLDEVLRKELKKQKQDKYHEYNDFLKDEILNKLYECQLDEEYESTDGVLRYYLKLKTNQYKLTDLINNNAIQIYDKSSLNNIHDIKIDKKRYFIGHNIIKIKNQIFILNGIYVNEEKEIKTNNFLYKYNLLKSNNNTMTIVNNSIDLNLVNSTTYAYNEKIFIVFGGFEVNLKTNKYKENEHAIILYLDDDGNIINKQKIKLNFKIKNIIENKKNNNFMAITSDYKDEYFNQLVTITPTENLVNSNLISLNIKLESSIPKEIDNLKNYTMYYFNECIYIIGGIIYDINYKSLNYNKFIYMIDLNRYMYDQRFWYKINGFENQNIFYNNIIFSNDKDLYFMNPIIKKDNLFYLSNKIYSLKFNLCFKEDFNLIPNSGQTIQPNNNYYQNILKNKNISYIENNVNFETYRDLIHFKNIQFEGYLDIEEEEKIDTENILNKYFKQLKNYIDNFISNNDNLNDFIDEKNKILESIQQQLDIIFNDNKHFKSFVNFNKNKLFDFINTIKPLNITILDFEDNFEINDIPFNQLPIADHFTMNGNLYFEEYYKIDDFFYLEKGE